MGLGASISLTDVHIRAVQPDDDMIAITDLLHQAYAPLARAGMRFMATHQEPSVTRERFDEGHGFVAVAGERIIGTITIYSTQANSKCDLYQRPGVWHFGQYAVDPRHQGIGLGALLLDFAEHYARLRGAHAIALDTAETATALIEYYTSKSYEHTGYVQWDETNYRSVLLSKDLT